MGIPSIKIEDYNYPLPYNRIAKYPLPRRDSSKLLYFSGNNMEERSFNEIDYLLDRNSLLIFNETRVIQARLLFETETGASIEIFCLEPIEPVNDFQLAFEQKSPVVWKCFVGNVKRWKTGRLKSTFHINEKEVIFYARKKKRNNDWFFIEFSWEPSDVQLSGILETKGLTPLPPYLHRKAETADKIRYQTVYARLNGSVAAPTAGLHFTPEIIDKIRRNGIETDKLILHVGAGTFKPVSSQTIAGHEMHSEKISISSNTLQHLLKADNKKIIPVGTTSMRSLESLFWMALRYYHGIDNFNSVKQWDPYQLNVPKDFDMKKALTILLSILEKKRSHSLEGETQMIIVPGYRFRFAKGLITNFHQPKSTLLLLVSALIGNNWKKVYNFALKNDFRFLSYGDSCLFLP